MTECDHVRDEVGISFCEHGCKFYRCRYCQETVLFHSKSYGCNLTKVEVVKC
jgi:hypothetical protein